MSYGNEQSTYSKITRVYLLRIPQKEVQWTFKSAFSRDAVFFINTLAINVTHTQATVKVYVLYMYLYGYTV